jgi:peptidoglycan/LPS O-acetylase OafA/YrhL
LAYLCVTLYRHGGQVVFVTGAINGALLVATFLAGVSIYLYRELIPWNNRIGLASTIAMFLLLGYIPYGDFLAPIPAAYSTVYFGLMSPHRKFLRGADYSYGIYLYGFAVQQTMVDLFPAAHIWYFNILICLPCIVLIAACSWHFVERPAGKLRRVAQWGEKRWLEFRLRRPSVV